MGEREFGRYIGELVLEPLQGGKPMKTMQDFSFLDADGKHWPVPPGTSLEGASIPEALQSLWGGSWQGKFRKASVVHDYHCTARTAAWQSVHRMFYSAMLASGVAEQHAKLVYAGLYFAGPRWKDMIAGSEQLGEPAGRTQKAPGDVLYALCRDPVTLAVSEAIQCEGTSAFDWITSAHEPRDCNSEIVLKLEKLADMVQDDAPSLPNLEAAIDYAIALIPHVGGSPRSISAGRLAVLD